MRTLVFILALLSTLPSYAQFGQGVAAGRWEPRNYATKLGLVADWDPGNASLVTLNGAGISRINNRDHTTNALLQATAGNQPLISRADNKGNLLVQSETFSTTWTRLRTNPFGVDDSGNAGAGSFANTSRTLDPLGGNTADFIQEDATAANSHDIYQGFGILTGAFTYSISAKPAGRTWLILQLWGASGTAKASFDVQNGTVGTVATTGTGASASATITAQANGFYLCVLNGTLTTAETHVVDTFIGEANNDPTFDGNNTSGLFIWGASLRPSSWDSTYIPTVATIALPGLNGRKTIYTDGTAHYLKTAAFTLNQPTTVIWVGKQWTWTDLDRINDGNASASMGMAQRTNTPALALNAGTVTATNGNLALGTYGVATEVFNGASSSLQINKTTSITGDAGAANAGGFTIASAGVAGNYANTQVARVLISNKVLATNELEYLRFGGLKMAGVK